MSIIKVLYISYDGMTDPLGQSQVLPYLVGLSKLNYTIHLISFEKEERYVSGKIKIEKLINHTNIIWHPLPYHHNPPVLSTILDLWNLNKKVKEITKNNVISLIHCRSYIASIIGLATKRNQGIPFLFDMRGFWADERVDGKIWNLRNPIFNLIYRYFKNKEKQFICEADYIVSLTQNAKTEIQSWRLSPNNENNIEVIPCCADFEHFSIKKLEPNHLSKLKNELGIEANDFVISYIGSLGTWYMIDEMMDFFSIAISKIPNCKFLILTTDNPLIAINAAKKAGIDTNKLVIKKAERNEVPLLIALSRFSLFFIKPAFSKKASSPTKLAEILGMGIPVVCNSNVGDVEQIIEKGKVGFALKEFNKNAYEHTLNLMLSYLPANTNYIAVYAKEYASLDDGVVKYNQIYRQIIKVHE